MQRSPENSFEYQYIDDAEREQLIYLLRKELNVDLSDYSKSSVSRRFTKMFNDFGVKTSTQFMNMLFSQNQPSQFFLQHFTVNVTEMFRDPLFYNALITKVFPKLAQKEQVKIWSAASSSGEEPISLAILLHESKLLDKTIIIASDISSSILSQATVGKYRLREMEGYQKSYSLSGGQTQLNNYFTLSNEFATINPQVTKRIEYVQHNLLDAPVAYDFDLVVCRNVLIYFNKELQNRVIENLYQSLVSAKSFLALGSKESIIFYNNRERFKEIDREYRIFQKAR